MSIDRHGARMGREVGKIAFQLGVALGCPTCGIGKAIDIVSKRWGERGFDWAGEGARTLPDGRGGILEHICANTTWNLTQKPTRKIQPWEWASTRLMSTTAYGPGTAITDAEKNARCQQIEAQMAEWAAKHEREIDGHQIEFDDVRLPPERDDEAAL